MRELRPDKNEAQSHESAAPWQVPVAGHDIAETGRHFDLLADAEVRACIARLAGVRDLPRLEASFDVTRHGAEGLHVVGRVSATVGQTCVVTLEPLTNEINESIDLVFTPRLPGEEAAVVLGSAETAAGKNGQASPERNWNAPEPLFGGSVDLGALATEFLLLGINPYPRKPGAMFEPPADDEAEPGPFAALARLTKGRDGH